MQASTSLAEKRFLVPLVLVTSLFFLWAIGVGYRSSRPELAQPERGLAPDIG
jgi:hypothetical protein